MSMESFPRQEMPQAEAHAEQTALTIDTALTPELTQEIAAMPQEQQEALAQGLFDSFMERFSSSGARRAYEAYQKMKGTPFADKFKQLEDARLTGEGYARLGI